MKKYAGEEFLNRLYKELVHSDEVVHTAKGRNKNEDLAIYLERLERITNETRDKNRVDLLKHFYYKKYIVKEENIPESYFENQKQMALERGYGHITYTEKNKKDEREAIISEQKASLDRWLDYFVSDDSKHYPMWFKYYVFQNIMKIGHFDKEKNEFTKRTSSTIKPFIEINREAIAMLYDELYKYLDKQEITDEQLEQLIKNGSFNKIYSYIQRKLNETKKLNNNSNEGIWKKYERGSNPQNLFDDIHGKGTGWCTAGGIETATAHLKGGDFHVYYTKDENGEYTNPRIAIRMEYWDIAEIRGIAENQNLESEMEWVVEKKLNEFPDKEKYKKKVSDMKKLTKIYNKHKNNEELTGEELRFLYEIDSKIIGFGYEKDPRIEEIKSVRFLEVDLSKIFGIKVDEISFTTEEALHGNYELHYGDFELNKDQIDLFPNFERKYNFEALGNVSRNEEEIMSKKNNNLFVFPKIIVGKVDLKDIKEAKDLILPEEIIGDLDLNNLEKFENIKFPKRIVGYLSLDALKSTEGLILPQEINGGINLSGLITAKELVLPQEINRSIVLRGLTSAEGLVLPQEINGSLDLRGLTSVEGLVLPQEINGSLDLSGLTSAKGLVLPQKINGYLNLSGLTSAEGLVLPQEINGDLYLSELTSPEGLVLPQEINGSLDLSGLTSAEGLVLPQEINGDLKLSGLTSAEGLVLPQKINGYLELIKLTSAKGMKFPSFIEGKMYLCSITSVEGIILPKNEQGEYYVPGKVDIFTPKYLSHVYEDDYSIDPLNGFTQEALIEEARITEMNNKQFKIFENIDNNGLKQ